MGHGLYNTFLVHDPWIVQHFCHPWAMGCTRVMARWDIHDPWVVQHSDHPWVVGCTTLWLSMAHGLYNTLIPMTHGLYNTLTPHSPWVVQHSDYPWVMGCAMLLLPVGHGLFNAPDDICYSYLITLHNQDIAHL